MGQAISTSSLWGSQHFLRSGSRLESFEEIIDSAFMLGGLGPMLMSTDISKCLEVLKRVAYPPLQRLRINPGKTPCYTSLT